jgi:MFS family permease
MIGKFKTVYKDYPPKFWVLVFASFIDLMGMWLIMPFFSLYVTKKYEVGMTEAGILLAIFAACGAIGSIIGGALTDKFGRKKIAIFGLVASGISNIFIGLAPEFWMLYILAGTVGLISRFGGPARAAMIADLLPKEKTAEGFGVLRIAVNIAASVGPMIGGLLATRSYLLLFIIDAISSFITAVILFAKIPETKPEASVADSQKSILVTLSEYKHALRDKKFVGFLIPLALMCGVYTQMMSTLSVYLRDYKGVPEQGYGALITINATLVIALQFWITRKLRGNHPLKVMAFGMVFYIVGFSMYGFVSGFGFFIAAMVIITVGEMVVTPTEQGFVAQISPENMRGRYMAVRGLAWTISGMIGRLAAGVILDYVNPDWVWYVTGFVGAIAMLGFYLQYQKEKGETERQTQVGKKMHPASTPSTGV